MFEMTDAMHAVADAQGWNVDTLLALALQFIASSGGTEDFEQFIGEEAVLEDNE